MLRPWGMFIYLNGSFLRHRNANIKEEGHPAPQKTMIFPKRGKMPLLLEHHSRKG
jgi:hypothetical protein